MPFRSRARLYPIGIILFVLLVILVPGPHPATVLAQSPPPVYLPIILSPAPTNVSYPPTPPWLQYLNQYRAQANLPPLQEEPVWSDGAWKHARYMVKNDIIVHEEDPQKPWYSPDGDIAGRNSNVLISTSLAFSETQAIDLWMQGPFHALGILDPRLERTGFGIYHENIGSYKTGATLDVLRGRTTTPASSIRYPILWPSDGQTTALDRYNGSESPNPLTSCGFTAPSGLPILMQFGSGERTPKVLESALYNDQTHSLPHCVYTESTYYNPDLGQQNLGRNILNTRDAVVLIPQAPLQAGTYTVSIKVDLEGQISTYTWRFSVNPTLKVGSQQVEAEGESPTQTMVEP